MKNQNLMTLCVLVFCALLLGCHSVMQSKRHYWESTAWEVDRVEEVYWLALDGNFSPEDSRKVWEKWPETPEPIKERIVSRGIEAVNERAGQ